MVFPKLVITIALIVVLFFFICESEGASYASASDNVGHGADINIPLAHQKVNVSVYYDSLCRSCAKFIIEDLRDIFDSNLISIVNLQLVPWANAYANNTNNSISCQNGPDECELNSLESCALNHGYKVLGKSYINQTAQLDLPPSFVPWVVVNNQPVGKDYANFAHYVCKAYRGVAVPGVCNTPLK